MPKRKNSRNKKQVTHSAPANPDRLQTSNTNLQQSPNPTIPAKLKVLIYLPNSELVSEKHLILISNLIPKIKITAPLLLVVNSVGGNLFTALKIARLLRERFDGFDTLIPEKAYSAATLLSLGSKQIYMSVNSRLGPIDLPIESPTDGSRISSLDVINAATTISSFVDEIAERRFIDLRDPQKYNIRNRAEAAKIAFDYATQLVLPVMGKVDPYQTQKSYREIKIAWWYAFDLLTTGMMTGKTDEAWQTCKKLTTFFPSHEYDIYREDVKYLLKLDVSNLEAFTEWSKIEPEYKKRLDAGTIADYIEI